MMKLVMPPLFSQEDGHHLIKLSGSMVPSLRPLNSKPNRTIPFRLSSGLTLHIAKRVGSLSLNTREAGSRARA